MNEKYAEVIEAVTNLLSQELLKDKEGLIGYGDLLDKLILELLRTVGIQTLGVLYAAVDSYLVKGCQRQGWQIESHKVVKFCTLFGWVETPPAYLWKPGAGYGVRPLKERMGVEGRRYSPAVERVLVDFGSEKSFARAAVQFKEHYGFEVARGIVHGHTESVGQQAQDYLRQRLDQAEKQYGQGVRPVERLGVEVDGCLIRTGVLMSAHEAGREDLPGDKRVRKEEWKEVRTGLVRPLEETARTYVCQQADYATVCQDLYAAACDCGLGADTHVIAPGDGGNGLCEEMAVHFAQFQYILDHRHLESHLFATAEALGMEGHDRNTWVKACMDLLWANRVEELLKRLEQCYEQTRNDRLRRLIQHLKRFAEGVSYGEFKEKGWPVGSGEVESAHRYIPQERLKIAGACWHPLNLNPMLALRIIRANGGWEAFWQWLQPNYHAFALA